MNLRAFFRLLAACLVFVPAAVFASGRLLQLGTLSSLVEGVYDGTLAMETIQRPEAYGLGTFDRLDGEMIVLDGVVYRVGVDGAVNKPSVTSKVPFASVSVLTAPDIDEQAGAFASKAELEAFITARLPSLNYPVLIVLEGDFADVTTRSVPAQAKPYPTLAQVVADGQVVFPLGAQKGVAVGFYFPPAFAGLNAPGFHLHFIDETRKCGGHVMDIAPTRGRLRLQVLTSAQFILPPLDSDFASSELSTAKPAAKVVGE